MKYIIYCTEGMKSNETILSRSDERKFLLRREARKFFRTSTGFEPATSRYRCDALTNVSGFIAQLVRASHRYREVAGSNPVEVLKNFQASRRNRNLRSSLRDNMVSFD